jgi:pimeloyl-ACP methyl ester carboxylesterase
MKTLRRQGFFTTEDKADIYYEVHGDKGPVLVLTYGIACVMNHWRHQVYDFAKDHQILMYDIRGHHQSTMGQKECLRVDDLSLDLAGLFEHVFPEETKASFWGHSFGAPISFRLASLKPELVSSLIFINGFYKNPFEEIMTADQCSKVIEALVAFNTGAPSFSKFLWSKATNSLLFHYIAGMTGGFNLERVSYKDIEIYSKGLASIDLENFFRLFDALIQFKGATHFQQTLCPSLIVHGNRDGLIPLDQSKVLSECLPNAELLEFEEGSHCTQLDLPVELNLQIRDFIRNKQ